MSIILGIFFVVMMAFLGTRKYYLDEETRHIRRHFSEARMAVLALVITTAYTTLSIRAEVDTLAVKLNPIFDQLHAVAEILLFIAAVVILVVYGFVLYYASVFAGNLMAAHLRRKRNQY